MHVLEARYSVETPFIQGQSGARVPEISAASFKSALRFWWRARAWEDPTFEQNPHKIREAERQLLGPEYSWDAPSELTLTLNATQRLAVGTELDIMSLGTGLGSGACFMAFGLWDIQSYSQGVQRVLLQRPCVLPPAELKVRMVSREPFSPALIQAFKLLGLLGGLGCKSRRGFGSLTLQRLVLRVPKQRSEQLLFEAPTSLDAYVWSLRELVSMDGRRLPPFPASSSHARVVLLGTAPSPSMLLEQIGVRMQRQRHQLRQAMDRGGLREFLVPRFSQRYRGSEGFRSSWPIRRYVASELEDWEGGGHEHPVDKGMAALAFHIQRLGDERYIGLASILPSADQARIQRETLLGGGPPDRSLPPYLDELLLRTFLQGYVGPGHARAGQRWFPEARMLLPAHHTLEQERHPRPDSAGVRGQAPTSET